MAAGLIVRREEPLCAEPDPARLVDSFLTAEPDFFIRNHGPIPTLAGDHRIAVIGLVDRPGDFGVADFEARFPATTIIATVQCAGNRRAHLQQVAPTSGDPWGVGAIGTAQWTGVALTDLLTAVGVQPAAAHVVIGAADLAEGGGAVAPYEVSIPLALAGDVVIAWAMNGAPLTPAHGYPLRLIAPGQAGVRSVKWVTRIELRAQPSAAPMHARDYRQFAPDIVAETADWDAAPPIHALPLNSAICEPAAGATVAVGPVAVRGWATASASPVARVEVSGDGGRSWIDARLERGPDRFSWVLWTATVELPPGLSDLVVRAFDEAGGEQPADPAETWNFKGYLSNAWHRVTVDAR